eukprot:CAMPEP_0197628678 /NCGR_PEP_ID=MMETSP1338-20131121/6878_1 /TAXON_ID=43686 ORGANISM="Pelagodinium beii, Strain RCC1491" /NCGR_SAMPLE_ID=MMETSP1338 /ASSEMBLY_ACC=CAM_ASM_000754 /LENGTH=466 /DNA_ID=CAMNT_0043199669 /DNA_START=69 /DNA_END=1469 /DNA_ORIENTATION=+
MGNLCSAAAATGPAYQDFVAASEIDKKLKDRKTMVIVGGGYAGATLAKTCDPEFNVILINKTDYLLQVMAAHRVTITGKMDYWEPRMRLPYNYLLNNGAFVKGEVTAIETSHVELKDGRKIPFDVCACATGTKKNGFFVPGEMNGSTKSTDVKPWYESVQKELSKAKSIIVVGGGIVGVETIAEMAALPNKPKLTLLSSGPAFKWADLDKKLSEEVLKQLKEKKIEVVFGAHAKEVPSWKAGGPNSGTIKTEDGKSYSADVIINCTGSPPILPGKHPFQLDGSGHIKIDKKFKAEGVNSQIYALGDCCVVPEGRALAYYGFLQAMWLGAQLNTKAESTISSDFVLAEDYEPDQIITWVHLGEDGGSAQLGKKYQDQNGLPEFPDKAVVAMVKGGDLWTDATGVTAVGWPGADGMGATAGKPFDHTNSKFEDKLVQSDTTGKRLMYVMCKMLDLSESEVAAKYIDLR